MTRAASIWCSLGLSVTSGFAEPLTAGPAEISEQAIYDRIVLTPFPAQPQPPNTVPLTADAAAGEGHFLRFNAIRSRRICLRKLPRAPDGVHRSQFGGQHPGGSRVRCRCRSGRASASPRRSAMPRSARRDPNIIRNLQEYIGGTFWDGRTPDTAHQARMPFLDPNEMANAPTGPSPPHPGGFSSLVAQKAGRTVPMPRSSGIPSGRMCLPLTRTSSSTRSRLLDRRLRGLGRGRAVQLQVRCVGTRDLGSGRLRPHAVGGARARPLLRQRPVLPMPFLGQPPVGAAGDPGQRDLHDVLLRQHRRPEEPEQSLLQRDRILTPIRWDTTRSGRPTSTTGSGSNPNPGTDGTVFMNVSPGDIPMFRGMFKAPSLRNADKRPNPSFVKAYMHNGFFKSLKDVVHFYNKRNVAAERRRRTRWPSTFAWGLPPDIRAS
jgi:hypothetical protein